MASRSTRESNGHTWVFVKAANGKRRAIRLGLLSDEDAAEATRRLERLERHCHEGGELDKVTEAWLESLPKTLFDRVVSSGLVSVNGAAKPVSADQSLSRLLIEWRSTLDVEPQTLVNYDQVGQYLKRYFGADRDVTTITPAEGDKFRTWLVESGRNKGDKPLSRATVSKTCKVARRIFEFARRLRWVYDNPLGHLKAGGEVNREREVYVTPRLVDHLVDLATDEELRTMIVLSRFATMRGPSEFEQLKWSDIDWRTPAIRITAPKTKRYEHGGRRTTPLCDRCVDALNRLWDSVEEESPEAVFPRLGTLDSSQLSGRLQRLCREAGVALWAKPWINLRASCETDWQEEGRSIFETAEWMGHAPEIALRHYNRVAKDRVADLPAVAQGEAKQSDQQPPTRSTTRSAESRSGDAECRQLPPNRYKRRVSQ